MPLAGALDAMTWSWGDSCWGFHCCHDLAGGRSQCHCPKFESRSHRLWREYTQYEARTQPFTLSQLQATPPSLLGPKGWCHRTQPYLCHSLSLTQVPLRAGRIISMQPLRSTSPVATAGHQDVTQDLALLALLALLQ